MRNLHESAVGLAKNLHSTEAELVSIFHQIDGEKSFRTQGYRSLFQYSLRALGLSEAITCQIITVSRNEELRKAVGRGEITVSKGKSIAAVVNRENAKEWLGYAREKSTRELEKLVSKKTGRPIEKKVTFSPETLALMERVQEVVSQKENHPASFDEAMRKAAFEYLRKNDPLERFTLHGKNRALKRDAGRCQFVLPDGKICGERIWLHVHHKIYKSQGGTDLIENLTTLCAAHHRITHKR